MLFSFCKRNEIAAVNGNQDRCLAPLPSQIVIRSSDYVFANSTQIRGSIPGEDNFVMRGKLDSTGKEKKGGKFRDGIYDLKGGCGIMGTVR